MDLLLQNKSVLITGGAQGLGKGISRLFLSEGANVTIGDINEMALSDTYQEFTSEFPERTISLFQGDLTKTEAINDCIQFATEASGNLDIVIANLGSGRGQGTWDMDEDEWSRLFDLNFTGARRLIQGAIPRMLKSGGGSIILISSIAGTEMIGAPVHYSVAKASLIAYAKNLSHLLDPAIRINTVAPGNIYFAGGTWEKKLEENEEKVRNMLKDEVPQNRFALPEDIANLVVFLASDKASFITGSCIIIDGGQTITL
jgi:3-oxoacyl-[acyl-carrier protein] reductase